MKTISALLVAVLVSGCTTTGPAPDCAGWRPIRLDAASIDGLTDQDAAAILAHNLQGQSQGCW